MSRVFSLIKLRVVLIKKNQAKQVNNSIPVNNPQKFMIEYKVRIKK